MLPAIDIHALVVHWGYPFVAIGTFLEGEGVLLAAAAMAHAGMLSLPLVMLAAFVGSLAGDQLWFLVGRRYGRTYVASRPRLAAAVGRVDRWAARWGSWFVLGFRFLYGLRVVSPLVLGASGYPAGRFVALNATGAAIWSVALGLAGYAVGMSLHALLGRAATAIEAALAAAVVVAAIVMIRRARRGHRRAAGEGDHDAGARGATSLPMTRSFTISTRTR